jgi:hypothetical protein
MRHAVPTFRWLAVLGILLPAMARGQQRDTLATALFALNAIRPGEPSWAPVFRLRDAEVRYAGTGLWSTYAQLRSQAEARVGNHEGALRFWDEADGYVPGPAPWPAGLRARAALPLLAAVADTAQVIMVNERHHAASDRLLTLQLLPVLWTKGFRYLALETLASGDSGLSHRGYPLEQTTGYYTDDPVFGEVMREALRLGYRIVPYESDPSQEDTLDGLNRNQRRDSIQALNLFRNIFRGDPHAKVLVHAGYAHIQKAFTTHWWPMAAYFRKLSGIDPVTADQTELSERSAPEYESPAFRIAIGSGLLGTVPIVLVDSAGRSYRPDDQPVDFEVLSPRTTQDHGRPSWMALSGRRRAADVPTPECQMRYCVVEARLAAEPDNAVAVDRTEGSYLAHVRLFLPRGQRVRVRIADSAGTAIRTARLRVAP